jgi:predicted nucleic acid-binding protein
MVVADANLLVAMVSGDTRASLVFEKFAEWISDDVKLHAPALAQYEVANALTRLMVAGNLRSDRLEWSLNQLSLLPIKYHALGNPKRVVEIALELGRQNGYDASYIALAEELGAELWTLDGPLYRNASALGLPVRLLS